MDVYKWDLHGRIVQCDPHESWFVSFVDSTPGAYENYLKSISYWGA